MKIAKIMDEMKEKMYEVKKSCLNENLTFLLKNHNTVFNGMGC